MHYGKTPEPETPYQTAAQVWDDRIGSARVPGQDWRYMAFGSLILSAGFAGALNDYARTNDPFTKVGKQQIAVDVSSVIRASPDSFRVAWTERRYKNGQLSATERWTAILTIAVQPPRDAERLKANPLGIYVNAISWSREIGQ